MSEFHKEVSVELDVEVKVRRCLFGLLDMQVERGVQKTDGVKFCTLDAPLKLSFEECVL